MASEPLPHIDTPPLASHPFAPTGHATLSKNIDIPPAAFDAIVHLTNELFPGEVRVELSIDPEYPERPSFVFHVRQESRVLNIEEEVDREIEWHAQAARLAPRSLVRLRLLLA